MWPTIVTFNPFSILYPKWARRYWIHHKQYFLNGDGRYDVVRDGKLLYNDSSHLSVDGAKLLCPMFEPLFQNKEQATLEDQELNRLESRAPKGRQTDETF
jgi:hypothetical protein